MLRIDQKIAYFHFVLSIVFNENFIAISSFKVFKNVYLHESAESNAVDYGYFTRNKKEDDTFSFISKTLTFSAVRWPLYI